MEQVIPLLILGLAAGVLSGMFGIGGGVVIVPVLVTLFAYELPTAVGTSLGALLLPVSIFAVIQYYRAGKMRISVSAIIAAGLIVGGYFGSQLALNLPVETLQRLYGAFLLYASWRFMEPRKWLAEIRAGQKPVEVVGVETTAPFLYLLILGLGSGVVSGMFGVGGGIVIVPALVAFLKFDQKVAVGTSLGALLLPVGLGGVISYAQVDKLDVQAAVMIAAGLVVGALGGARLALNLPSSTVKRLYGIFLLFVGLRFLLQVG